MDNCPCSVHLDLKRVEDILIYDLLSNKVSIHVN